MLEHTSEQDLKDRLSLIEQMIAEGRRTTESWGWTFVLWGLWHGAGFLIQRFWQALVVQRVAFLSAPNPVVFYASVATNFAFVAVGWLLFAAPTVPDAYAAFVHLFG